jgi:hypothetical protein
MDQTHWSPIPSHEQPTNCGRPTDEHYSVLGSGLTSSPPRAHAAVLDCSEPDHRRPTNAKKNNRQGGRVRRKEQLPARRCWHRSSQEDSVLDSAARDRRGCSVQSQPPAVTAQNRRTGTDTLNSRTEKGGGQENR